MRRYIFPAVLLAVLMFSLAQGTSYTYVVRELSQTMTGLFTFGAGATIPSGQKLFIGDSGNNNYLYGDASTGFMRVYMGGVLKATVTPSGVIPGGCPSSVWGIEQGTECFDPSTHKKWRHDSNGIHTVNQ